MIYIKVVSWPVLLWARVRPISTFVVNFTTKLQTLCTPFEKLIKKDIWESTPVELATISMSTFREELVPTFVARKPLLLSHSKANRFIHI